MRYINVIDDTIQFIDVDNTITNVPVNGVYTFIKGDTISFILLRRLDNEGYCVMTTRASDVEINGTVYSIDDYIDGTATQDLYTATGLRFEVVEELPDEGQSGVIYLVPNEDDTYDEYIWLEDEERFERVGNTDVDLSDYYTKSEVDTLLANYVTSTVFNNLVDEVEENGRVTAAALVDLDETKQDVISDLATIRSGAAAGATALQSSDLNGYATETYVNNAIAQIPQPDLSAYATVVDVEELEEGSAAALNDLNDRVDTIENADYATETYVNTAIGNIPSPDMSNYYTKEEIDALINEIYAVIVEDEEIVAGTFALLNEKVDNYHTYWFEVELVNLDNPGNNYTLDDDTITENVPQGTNFEINVTRFLGNASTGETLNCGDYNIYLESNNSQVSVNNCQFTTANVDEQQYTLEIDANGDVYTYDFTLEGQ